MKTNTLKMLFIGLLSALFFSSTFILNRYISLEGGHWFWSASLRYIYMIIFLAFGFILFKGYDYLKNILSEFLSDFRFWIVSGSVGFGVFYALICFVADTSPAWIVATTWQFTIISSLIVLSFFGKKVSNAIWFIIFLIFIGIILANFSFLNIQKLENQIFNILLILIASFAYPIGNQLVWEKKNDINTFSKIFLLSLGSLPFWFILSLFFDIGIPSKNQAISIIYVAIFSGIIATSLFLYARSKAKNKAQIAIVDSTQSGEVIFTLIIEILFLGIIIPNNYAFFGFLIIIVGLFGLVKDKR